MRSPAYRAGALVLFGGLVVILAAHGYELAGYRPCPLCLWQRYAYYFGVPVAFMALVLLAGDTPRQAALLLAFVALGYLINSGLAAWHAGIEWGWFAGPQSCAPVGEGTLSKRATDLFKRLESTEVVRCDKPSWRFLGLSFAGWNVPISLGLALTAMYAARRAAR